MVRAFYIFGSIFAVSFLFLAGCKVVPQAPNSTNPNSGEAPKSVLELVAKSETVATLEDTALEGELHAESVKKARLTYKLLSNTTKGVLELLDPNAGTFRFTPNANENGEDTFKFEVEDGTHSDSGTITITIKPVNDVPVLSDLNVTTDEDTPVTATLSVSDLDKDVQTFYVGPYPANGTVSQPDFHSGTFTYTPRIGFVGTDEFKVKVYDGHSYSSVATAKIMVKANCNAPELQNLANKTWHGATKLSASATTYYDNERANNNDLVADKSGNIYMTWVESKNTGDSLFYQKYNIATHSYETVETIQVSTGAIFGPSISINAINQIVIGWTETGYEFSYRAAFRTPTMPWTKSLTILAGGNGWPRPIGSFSLNNVGHFLPVFFFPSPSSGMIWYPVARAPAGATNWVVTDTATQMTERPTVLMTDKGRALVVWSQSATGGSVVRGRFVGLTDTNPQFNTAPDSAVYVFSPIVEISTSLGGNGSAPKLIQVEPSKIKVLWQQKSSSGDQPKIYEADYSVMDNTGTAPHLIADGMLTDVKGTLNGEAALLQLENSRVGVRKFSKSALTGNAASTTGWSTLEFVDSGALPAMNYRSAYSLSKNTCGGISVTWKEWNTTATLFSNYLPSGGTWQGPVAVSGAVPYQAAFNGTGVQPKTLVDRLGNITVMWDHFGSGTYINRFE